MSISERVHLNMLRDVHRQTYLHETTAVAEDTDVQALQYFNRFDSLVSGRTVRDAVVSGSLFVWW